MTPPKTLLPIPSLPGVAFIDLAAIGTFCMAACLALLAVRGWRRARVRAMSGERAAHAAGRPLATRPGGRCIRWVARLSLLVEPFLPAWVGRRLDALLRAAALDSVIEASEVVATQLLAASAFGGIAVAFSGGAVLPAVAAALIGGVLPLARLRDLGRTRKREAMRQLPALLDLLTLALEAGQGVSSALALAAQRLPAGPLRDELDRVQADVRTGRTRSEALHALAQRLAMPAASQLAATLAAGERQGASLGGLLRAQAAQRRQERFVRAERMALQAPVKLLAPLAICIFPGTFAVLFVPVVVRLLAEGVL